MQKGYSQKRAYADHRIMGFEFEEGDKVYLKISPMKGVVRFGKKIKLSPRYVGPYETLYGRRCRYPIGWFEVGEPSLLGPELIYKTLEKVHIIKNQLQMAYSLQRSYVDTRRRDLEFE